ncbi:MAG: class I SAM-dependent methyltransferase [Candidatus Muiribacteriota bacterium]
MNISEIIKASGKPALYTKGTSFMWSDEHISKQLLKIHLDGSVDLASRKKSTIEKTVNWILDSIKEKGKLNILDLGCGPGLYTEIFAEKGHCVTGVDISKNSIEYARESAKERNLDIKYINSDYLNIKLEPASFDLVILIYTDFGVLTPDERDKLLKIIYSVLKKGGIFIFDVMKDNEIEKKISGKNWECEGFGFWKDTPYIALSESFLFQQEKVILSQYIVIDTFDNIEIFRFWTHFFSKDNLYKMLKINNFFDISFRDDIIPDEDIWSGDNVIFAVCMK